MPSCGRDEGGGRKVQALPIPQQTPRVPPGLLPSPGRERGRGEGRPGQTKMRGPKRTPLLTERAAPARAPTAEGTLVSPESAVSVWRRFFHWARRLPSWRRVSRARVLPSLLCRGPGWGCRRPALTGWRCHPLSNSPPPQVGCSRPAAEMGSRAVPTGAPECGSRRHPRSGGEGALMSDHCRCSMFPFFRDTNASTSSHIA